jgi:glycosyltransferase involved in cell wall biosynthesis
MPRGASKSLTDVAFKNGSDLMLSEGKIRSLTVVIPVFNEEAIIERSLTTLSDALKAICFDYEILVVDDGSTDKTADILRRRALSIDGLKILHNARNEGLGGALRHGFKYASKAVVFYIDADMPFQYTEILRAVQILDESRAEGVAGFRIDREREPLLRRLSSLAYNKCVGCIYGVQRRDINCAFKLMKTDVLKRLDLKAKGSFIDAEWMIRAAYKGFKIKEMGVEYHPRRESGSRLFRIYPIITAFLEMIKFYTDIKRSKHVAGQARNVCP